MPRRLLHSAEPEQLHLGKSRGGYSGHPRNDFLEKLQPFPSEVLGKVAQPGGVRGTISDGPFFCCACVVVGHAATVVPIRVMARPFLKQRHDDIRLCRCLCFGPIDRVGGGRNDSARQVLRGHARPMATWPAGGLSRLLPGMNSRPQKPKTRLFLGNELVCSCSLSTVGRPAQLDWRSSNANGLQTTPKQNIAGIKIHFLFDQQPAQVHVQPSASGS